MMKLSALFFSGLFSRGIPFTCDLLDGVNPNSAASFRMRSDAFARIATAGCALSPCGDSIVSPVFPITRFAS